MSKAITRFLFSSHQSLIQNSVACDECKIMAYTISIKHIILFTLNSFFSLYTIYHCIRWIHLVFVIYSRILNLKSHNINYSRIPIFSLSGEFEYGSIKILKNVSMWITSSCRIWKWINSPTDTRLPLESLHWSQSTPRILWWS